MNGFLNTLAQYYIEAGKGAGSGGAASLQAATPAELFGSLSQRAAEADAADMLAAATGGFSSTTLYHAVALLLLICYVAVLYRNPDLLRSLRDYIFSPGSVRDQHLNDNRTNDPLRGFSWGRMVLDALFICTATLHAIDVIAPGAAAALPAPARLIAIPAAAAIFGLTAAYQNGMLAVAGAVTVSRPLTSALSRAKSIYFRLTTLMLTPVLLLWVLASAGRNAVLESVILLEVLFVTVVFLRETFLLFISKKLSIYHWILYLCTIEAFPLSLICLLAARA